MKIFMILISLILISACESSNTYYEFDLQGHRGARGLLPENTIPSFLLAVDLGADTIELDVVVSGDRKIVVSHEPWFNHKISTKPNGLPVTEDEERLLNIFEMTYDEIQQYDVGKRGHPDFPNQEPMEVSKPLLLDAIRAIEAYVLESGADPVQYNIETKSVPDLYEIYYPQPSEFATLLYDELKILNQEFDLFSRLTIQSFDPATLVEIKEYNPNITQAMLVYQDETIPQIIDSLGYKPEIWSPNYQLVTNELIEEAHSRNMKIIPWTINTVNEMRLLLQMGVDGIITDYPDSASVLKQNPGM